MTEVLLFHHAQGLTAGCLAFAETLRAAGHVVHTPDLYDGNTFAELDAGIAYASGVGFDTIRKRGVLAAEALPDALVYAGFSLGAMPAQQLAQSRPGAKGAFLMHAAIPPAEFGSPWPPGLPLQIHTMTDDELGDADVASELATSIDEAEVFLYPGDKHLFTDNSLAAYDADAAVLVEERALAFLDRIG